MTERVIFFARKGKIRADGALAGAANGFFGAGGGLFLVPLLTRWCGMEEKRAFATSVAVIFPLCALSAAVYYVRGGLPFAQSVGYLAGGRGRRRARRRIFGKLPTLWLRRAFALLLLYGGVRAVLLL